MENPPHVSRLTGMYVKKPLGKRLRRYFLVGLVVIAPVGLTIWVLTRAFVSIDAILGVPLRDTLGISIPGLGLVTLLLLVTMVGWVAHMAVGRQLIRWWNLALTRFPLAGGIYNAVSQIVQSVVGSRHSLFLRTVLVPYPTEGLWAVAFVTKDDQFEMEELLGEKCVNVFVPTTPNPTSGFMLIVPSSRCYELDTTVEEAMKLIISGGSVRARVSRKGIDLDTLLMDTREWNRAQIAAQSARENSPKT
jgi:uncharacterized membrane protein